MEQRPGDVLVSMLSQHAGKSCEVYLKGDAKPWELDKITGVFFDEFGTFIEGKKADDGHTICINTMSVSTIIYLDADDEEDGGGDDGEPLPVLTGPFKLKAVAK